jgi:hypothetical protein
MNVFLKFQNYRKNLGPLLFNLLISAYIYGFRSACASWANNASTEITINSMYLSLIDGNKARVLSCTVDKESLIFPSEDNFISPSRDKFQAAALSRVFTLGSLMRKLMQRRALAHNACVYVGDDIRGNFIIIYYFFNHTSQPSFHCWWKSIYGDSLSAAAWNIKSAFCLADVTAAARALWFVVSQSCQRLKIKMFMWMSAHGCEKCAETRRARALITLCQWQAGIQFERIFHLAQRQRDAEKAERCALFFDPEWLIKECLMNWEAYNIWLTNRLSDE